MLFFLISCKSTGGWINVVNPLVSQAKEGPRFDPWPGQTLWHVPELGTDCFPEGWVGSRRLATASNWCGGASQSRIKKKKEKKNLAWGKLPDLFSLLSWCRKKKVMTTASTSLLELCKLFARKNKPPSLADVEKKIIIKFFYISLLELCKWFQKKKKENPEGRRKHLPTIAEAEVRTHKNFPQTFSAPQGFQVN